MKEKISEIRKSLMVLQEQMEAIKPEEGKELTSRQQSLFERAKNQLNDAELNMMKLWRVL